MYRLEWNDEKENYAKYLKMLLNDKNYLAFREITDIDLVPNEEQMINNLGYSFNEKMEKEIDYRNDLLYKSKKHGLINPIVEVFKQYIKGINNN